MAITWQSRLAAVQNRISQKLLDNSIKLAGVATDVLMITEELNRVQDVSQIDLNSIQVLNIIFPALEDIPIRRFLQSSGTYLQASDGKSEKEPFICYAPISTIVEQGSIFLKFIENPNGVEPLVLPLKLADVIATLGARTIQYQKLPLVYYDTPINTTLYQLLLTLAQRRNILRW